MVNNRKKCKQCKEFYPVEVGKQGQLGFFHSGECLSAWFTANQEKVMEKARAKLNSDRRKENAARKRQEAAERKEQRERKAKLKLNVMTIGKLTDEAAKLLQKIVRLKAADVNGFCQCSSCDNHDHWKNMEGGHFISRGNAATKLDERNCNPQCHDCNQYGMRMKNAESRYHQWMVETYGQDVVDELFATKGKPYKWNREEVEQMIIDWRKLARDLEKRVPGL